MGTIKIAIGLVLIVISFIYLIKNPGQSMIEGLMKKDRVNQQKIDEFQASQKEDKDNADSNQ